MTKTNIRILCWSTILALMYLSTSSPFLAVSLQFVGCFFVVGVMAAVVFGPNAGDD